MVDQVKQFTERTLKLQEDLKAEKLLTQSWRKRALEAEKKCETLQEIILTLDQKPGTSQASRNSNQSGPLRRSNSQTSSSSSNDDPDDYGDIGTKSHLCRNNKTLLNLAAHIKTHKNQIDVKCPVEGCSEIVKKVESHIEKHHPDFKRIVGSIEDFVKKFYIKKCFSRNEHEATVNFGEGCVNSGPPKRPESKEPPKKKAKRRSREKPRTSRTKEIRVCERKGCNNWDLVLYPTIDDETRITFEDLKLQEQVNVFVDKITMEDLLSGKYGVYKPSSKKKGVILSSSSSDSESNSDEGQENGPDAESEPEANVDVDVDVKTDAELGPEETEEVNDKEARREIPAEDVEERKNCEESHEPINPPEEEIQVHQPEEEEEDVQEPNDESDWTSSDEDGAPTGEGEVPPEEGHGDEQEDAEMVEANAEEHEVQQENGVKENLNDEQEPESDHAHHIRMPTQQVLSKNPINQEPVHQAEVEPMHVDDDHDEADPLQELETLENLSDTTGQLPQAFSSSPLDPGVLNVLEKPPHAPHSTAHAEEVQNTHPVAHIAPNSHLKLNRSYEGLNTLDPSLQYSMNSTLHEPMNSPLITADMEKSSTNPTEEQSRDFQTLEDTLINLARSFGIDFPEDKTHRHAPKIPTPLKNTSEESTSHVRVLQGSTSGFMIAGVPIPCFRTSTSLSQDGVPVEEIPNVDIPQPPQPPDIPLASRDRRAERPADPRPQARLRMSRSTPEQEIEKIVKNLREAVENPHRVQPSHSRHQCRPPEQEREESRTIQGRNTDLMQEVEIIIAEPFHREPSQSPGGLGYSDGFGNTSGFGKDPKFDVRRTPDRPRATNIDDADRNSSFGSSDGFGNTPGFGMNTEFVSRRRTPNRDMSRNSGFGAPDGFGNTSGFGSTYNLGSGFGDSQGFGNTAGFGDGSIESKNFTKGGRGRGQGQGQGRGRGSGRGGRGRVPCRHFSRKGSCVMGDRCNFLHDRRASNRSRSRPRRQSPSRSRSRNRSKTPRAPQTPKRGYSRPRSRSRARRQSPSPKRRRSRTRSPPARPRSSSSSSTSSRSSSSSGSRSRSRSRSRSKSRSNRRSVGRRRSVSRGYRKSRTRSRSHSRSRSRSNGRRSRGR